MLQILYSLRIDGSSFYHSKIPDLKRSISYGHSSVLVSVHLNRIFISHFLRTK